MEGGSGGSDLVETTDGKSLEATEGLIRIRWFPVSNATGYTISVEDKQGAVVYEEPASPIGCSHRLIEGFTAGLCEYYFEKKGRAPFLQFSIRSQAHEPEN